MTYGEHINHYFKSIEEINIKEQNLLFWNLWQLNFIYEKIEYTDYKHFGLLHKSFSLLWDLNDEKITLNSLLKTPYIIDFYNIPDSDYGNLNYLKIPENTIREFMGGLHNLISGLKKGDLKNRIHHFALNVVENIVDCGNENEDTITALYSNEINAHLKIASELSKSIVNYTNSNKNIYR